MRVRLGVITKRDPLTYSYGPFSKWVEVRGIVEEGVCVCAHDSVWFWSNLSVCVLGSVTPCFYIEYIS